MIGNTDRDLVGELKTNLHKHGLMKVERYVVIVVVISHAGIAARNIW